VAAPKTRRGKIGRAASILKFFQLLASVDDECHCIVTDLFNRPLGVLFCIVNVDVAGVA
jgi:hypothetical protein